MTSGSAVYLGQSPVLSLFATISVCTEQTTQVLLLVFVNVCKFRVVGQLISKNCWRKQVFAELD